MAYHSTTFDRDKLNLVSRDESARAALAALDRLQHFQPHEQVAAIAMLFGIAVTRVRLDPEDTYRLGLKLIRPEDYHQQANMQLEVLRDYAGIQLAGDEDVSIM